MTGFEIVAALSAAASVASGVVGAMGAMQQGKAQSQAATYTAQVADRNAKIARQQADVEQEDQRRENMRQRGAIRAAYGGSGIEMAGSPLDVLEDTAMEQELDVERIGYRGTLRALGENDKANLARAEAENAKSAGAIGAMGSILKAGTSLLGNPLVKSKLQLT
jgi:hypothetical protein